MKKILAILLVLTMLIVPLALAEGEKAPIELKQGSRGEEVERLQRRLKELGYYNKSVDAFFGKGTERAVKDFQGMNGYEENGIASQEVIDYMNSASAIGAGENYEFRNLLYKSGTPVLNEVESDYRNGGWRPASGGPALREVVHVKSAPVAGIRDGIRFYSSEDDGMASDVAIDEVPMIYGEIYVLSCYAKGNGILRIQRGKNPYVAREYRVTDDWKQYSFAFMAGDGDGCTGDSSTLNIYFGIKDSPDTEVTVCGFMLEKANATQWRLSPAD